MPGTLLAARNEWKNKSNQVPDLPGFFEIGDGSGNNIDVEEIANRQID